MTNLSLKSNREFNYLISESMTYIFRQLGYVELETIKLFIQI